jgi:hypothetical protein
LLVFFNSIFILAFVSERLTFLIVQHCFVVGRLLTNSKGAAPACGDNDWSVPISVADRLDSSLIGACHDVSKIKLASVVRDSVANAVDVDD